MASLTIKHSPVHYIAVQFDDTDLHTIKIAAVTKNVTITHLTKMLGITRPYLYRGVQDNSLELSKLLLLQQFLDIQLITKDEIGRAVESLKQELMVYMSC